MDTLCLKTSSETHRSFCTADIIQILDLVGVQGLKTAWPSWSSSQSGEKKWVSNWNNSQPSLRWDGCEGQCLVRGPSFDSSLEVVYFNFLEGWLPLDWGSQRAWRMNTGLDFFFEGGGRTLCSGELSESYAACHLRDALIQNFSHCFHI